MQTPENVSRRRFIKRLAGGIAGVATLVAGSLFAAQNRKNHQPPPVDKTSYDAYPRPEGLPDDILTKEQLQEARITVYQIPEVQLYLRRGALDIPIFKDAAKHQINGLTISLIDNDRISWNAVSRLPDDARSVWQTVNRDKDPKEWPESHWQDLKRYEAELVDFHEKTRQSYQLRLAQIISGEEEESVRKNIDFYRSLISTNKRKQDQDALQYWEDLLKDIVSDKEEKRLQKKIQDEEKYKKEAEDSVRALNGPRDEAIKHFQEYGVSSPDGTLIRPNGEWDNKAYIYLCVGGDFQPDPTQSYPGPEQFKIFTDKDSYKVFTKDTLPGFTLRHEAGHYEKQDPDKLENERLADRIAFERLIEAWKKYQQTGDTSAYAFVFVSSRGVTITEKPLTNEAMRSI